MKSCFKYLILSLVLLSFSVGNPLYAAGMQVEQGVVLGLSLITVVVATGVLMIAFLTMDIVENYRVSQAVMGKNDYASYLDNLSSDQIGILLKMYKSTEKRKVILVVFAMLSLAPFPTFGQAELPTSDNLLSQNGILITIVLLLIPLLAGFVFLIVKIAGGLKKYRNNQNLAEAERLAGFLGTLKDDDLTLALEKRKNALDYVLSHNELAGSLAANDHKGLINHVDHEAALPFVARKRKANVRPKIDPGLSRLVIWFIGCATSWLLFGTTVGEYVGIKFVAPDADQFSWLSFGRLRPVHTNAVFWGWASLAMLGLGYYVVPRVSNTVLFSLRLGWYTLILINTAVFAGSVCLMSGINNGGGEYREYIWPVMLLFGLGLLLTLVNFFKTIANRTTKEIYISNWYIVSSIIFGIVISLVAYLPFWQNGLGETIIQGYYMHQGVGMWFMLFTLGIVYYFLPQQLNKPIYS